MAKLPCCERFLQARTFMLGEVAVCPLCEREWMLTVRTVPGRKGPHTLSAAPTALESFLKQHDDLIVTSLKRRVR